MALPLKASGEIIGAIDVQSTEVGAFSQEDVSILQTLADQLAVAIENTRLVEKLEASIEEANRLEKIQVEETWRRYTAQAQITGYQYDRMQLLPAEISVPGEAVSQLKAGQVVIQNSEERILPNGKRQQKSTLLVPLSLRDQLIGVIGIEQDEANQIWTENELAIAQAAANQVSLTLENARLLDETRQRAERERIASQITTRLRMSNDPNQILQTAVSELKHALGAKKAQVLIAPHKPGSEKEAQPTKDHPKNPDELTVDPGGNGHGDRGG
jgi:GAF domain-containing protein